LSPSRYLTATPPIIVKSCYTALPLAKSRQVWHAIPVDIDRTQLSLGGWCTLPSSLSFELMARAGFDWLCIDLQHGLIDVPTMVSMLQASAIVGTTTYVRVPSLDSAALMRVLDAGAAGAIAPMVNTAEQAETVVRACRYPPKGERSWGPARAELGVPEYSASVANDRTICGVQIETLEAVANLDDILQVEGIGLVMVGPSDLAVDLGLHPRAGVASARHGELLAEIAEKCSKASIPVAVYGGTAAGAEEFVPLGYRMILVAHDAVLLRDGAASALRRLRDGSAPEGQEQVPREQVSPVAGA